MRGGLLSWRAVTPLAVVSAVAALLVLLIVVGFGGPESPSGPPVYPSSASPALADTARTGGADGRSKLITWLADLMPLAPSPTPGALTTTPSSGFVPPIWPAARTRVYAEIAHGDCRTALDSATALDEPHADLYAGAAAACLAATGGRDELWPLAQQADAAVADDDATLECFDRDVLRLLRELVRAHRERPGTPPSVKDAPGPGTTSCPVITSVDPAHGPAAGGQAVRLTGVNLPDVVDVHFGTATVTATSFDGKHATAVTPAHPGGGVVNVTTDVWPFAPLARFSYDRPSGPAQSVSGASGGSGR